MPNDSKEMQGDCRKNHKALQKQLKIRPKETEPQSALQNQHNRDARQQIDNKNKCWMIKYD